MAETAVVGYPHDIFGEGIPCIYAYVHLNIVSLIIGIYAYVILKDNVTDDEELIKQDLLKLVKTQIGSFAVPQFILVRNYLE